MSVISAAGIGAIALMSLKTSSQPVSISTSSFPTIGNMEAKVELVLIADLRCTACKHFDQEIFPKIAEQYIATGKVRFSTVLVAFLEDSKIRANAAWTVYRQNHGRFFSYLHELFRFTADKSLAPEMLIQLAKEVGRIDVAALDSCIQSGCYFAEIDQNMDWAKGIMGNLFGTPALYINGVRTSVRSFEPIQTQIEKNL
ncbi:MAG: thioredoxin domain-containing protein [Chlamydiia bacterium]|nr:thioredoxin domain-containing protein [Chlamydiia bacterium]